MLLVHKIELEPNNKQRSYFIKASGVARFAYNWALDQWENQYKEEKKPRESEIRRQLNRIKNDPSNILKNQFYIEEKRFLLDEK